MADWIQRVAADEAALTQTLDTEGEKLNDMAAKGLSAQAADQLGESLKAVASAAARLQADLREATRLLSLHHPEQDPSS